MIDNKPKFNTPFTMGLTIGDIQTKLVCTPYGDIKDPQHLMDTLGVLPYWAALAITDILNSADPLTVDNIRANMEESYGLGAWKCSGEVKSGGVYTYPKDPDLHPLATIATPAGNIFFYPYAMVGFVPNREGLELGGLDFSAAYVVRMD